jgi:hypothetical protein
MPPRPEEFEADQGVPEEAQLADNKLSIKVYYVFGFVFPRLFCEEYWCARRVFILSRRFGSVS